MRSQLVSLIFVPSFVSSWSDQFQRNSGLDLTIVLVVARQVAGSVLPLPGLWIAPFLLEELFLVPASQDLVFLPRPMDHFDL